MIKDGFEIVCQTERMFVAGEVRWGENNQFKVHENWKESYSIYLQLLFRSETQERFFTTQAAADSDLGDLWYEDIYEMINLVTHGKMGMILIYFFVGVK